jgi:hypothetical protein
VSLDELVFNAGFAVAAVITLGWAVSGRVLKTWPGDAEKLLARWPRVDDWHVPSRSAFARSSEATPRSVSLVAHALGELRSSPTAIGAGLGAGLLVLGVMWGAVWTALIGTVLLGVLGYTIFDAKRTWRCGRRTQGRVIEVGDPKFFGAALAAVELGGRTCEVAVPWRLVKGLRDAGGAELLVLYDPDEPGRNLLVGVRPIGANAATAV